MIDVVFIVLLLVIVLRPWHNDNAELIREQKLTRHAVCKLLDEVGADSVSIEDVEACL